MQQVKRQAEKDIGKPPQDRDTRDYPIGGRKPMTKPRKSDREPEPPPPPREGLPSGPPVGAGGGENPQKEMIQMTLKIPIQMRVMKRSQTIQRLQRSQVSCMMKKGEK